MGDVITLPSVRSCFLCAHHAIGSDSVTRCQLHDESVDSELYAARNCSSYEPA